MPATQLPDPFKGVCQRCDKPIGEDQGHYTVVDGRKEKYICEHCYRELIGSEQVNEGDPAPYTPPKR